MTPPAQSVAERNMAIVDALASGEHDWLLEPYPAAVDATPATDVRLDASATRREGASDG